MSSDKFVYALEERIGDPDLFVGRKKELEYLNKWLEELTQKLSKSTAILSRRKKGKTAIVERFYNIIYNKNRNIIPFYFEVKEGKKWIVDFSELFFASFISQYLGFKLKKTEYCRDIKGLEELKKIAVNNDFVLISEHIKEFQTRLKDTDKVDKMWDYAQSAPHRIASVTDDFIVQIIDEFQFLNSEICWDQKKEIVADDLAGSYLSLAESKVAPLLVTGSWVGWLKRIIRGQLPARFREIELGNLPEEEGLEAVLNYSVITGVEVDTDVAVYLNDLVNSDPYYISAIIRSFYEKKDLTSKEGFLETLEYEVRQGDIYYTWMEYILNTIDEVNDKHGKKIVLFLSKNREREWTRQEIIERCKLPYNEKELEQKLRELEKGDLISEGSSSMRYKGMSDDIFYKVFRYRYQEEIDNFPIEKIEKNEKEKEMKKIKKLQEELQSLKGKRRYYKGLYLEYILNLYLKFKKYKKEGVKLEELVENYQPGACFTDYRQVKKRVFTIEQGNSYEIDIFAESFDEGKNLYFEVKNCKQPVHKGQVENFIKFVQGIKLRKDEKGYFIFYSLNGFTEEAEKLLKENNIMYSSLDMWDFEFVK